jgi:ferredoxin
MAKVKSEIKINHEDCIGCGLCTSLCPDVFEMIDNKARVKNPNANCKDAVKECPVGAIKIS